MCVGVCVCVFVYLKRLYKYKKSYEINIYNYLWELWIVVIERGILIFILYNFVMDELLGYFFFCVFFK